MSNQKHDEQDDRKFQKEKNLEQKHKGLGNVDFPHWFQQKWLNSKRKDACAKLRVPPKTSPRTKFIWKQLGLDMQRRKKTHVAQISSKFRHSGRADLAHNDPIQSWSKTYSNVVRSFLGQRFHVKFWPWRVFYFARNWVSNCSAEGNASFWPCWYLF